MKKLDKIIIRPIDVELLKNMTEETEKLMQEYDSVAESYSTKERLDKLLASINEVANAILCEPFKVQVFGSRMTDLADSDSDIDVFLQTGW